MPAPQLTQELKNDLKLLRMRNALDPARHYKTADSKNLPRYFQVSMQFHINFWWGDGVALNQALPLVQY